MAIINRRQTTCSCKLHAEGSQLKFIDIARIPSLGPNNSKPYKTSFDIGDDIDCFCIYMHPPDEYCTINAVLTDPNGTAYPPVYLKPYFNNTISNSGMVTANNDILTIPTPILPRNPLPTGTWSLKVSWDNLPPILVGDLAIRMVKRVIIPGQETKIMNYQLDVNVVLCWKDGRDSKYFHYYWDWIRDQLDVVAAIFARADIQVVFTNTQSPTIIKKSSSISDRFWNDLNTEKLVVENFIFDQLTLIFVEDFDITLSNEYGISGGIPGPQGFESGFGAALVKITNRPDDPLFNNRNFLGLTAAHEIGHYLGLTHGSASDVKNLMYPHLGSRSNGSLNFEQTSILYNAPLVKIIYDDIATKD